MNETLALFISIALVLTLIRKIGIGVSLFIGSAVLAYSVLGTDGFRVIFEALVSIQTLEIVAVVVLAFTLGYSMEYFGMLNRLADELSDSLGALSLVVIPLLIGLLPMPGGALISAVMLAPLLKKYPVSAEKATILNYWFRHIWVTVWPLYPSVIIGAAVLEIDYFAFAHATLPISLCAFLAGLLLTRGLNIRFRVTGKTVRALAVNLYPIGVLILLSVVIKLPLLLSLLVCIAAVYVHQHAGKEDIPKIISRTMDKKIIVLVFAVMCYKAVIESSGVAESLLTDISLEFPTPVAAFILTLVVGFSTGIEMSYSSIALPLLTGFTGVGAINFKNLMLVIAAGYLGVMLSPMHLCYVLTAEYFGTDVSKTYRQLTGIVVLVTAAVWLIYFM